jgi:hypothetical protein
MKKELRDKWVTALRSGDYNQGRRSLKKNGLYCCLGVLCEIGGVKQVKVVEDSFPCVLYEAGGIKDSFTYTYFEDSTGEQTGQCLTSRLLKELGLTADEQDTLIGLNDKDTLSFNEIADWIEENIKCES